MICRICYEKINPDEPNVCWGCNPQTFRYGWMHTWCALSAMNDLRGQPAKEPEYQDRYDEYIMIDEIEF